jgi:tetratricopeptide (TPR) repeat protein
MLLLPLFTMGQYQSLLHKSYAENIAGYSKLYVSLIDLKDSAKIENRVDSIKTYALNHNDPALALEMDLFMCYHNIEFKGHRGQKCIDDLKALIERSAKAHAPFVKIRAIRVLANFYWVYEKNYELAFEQYLLLEKEVDQVSATAYPEKPRDLVKIGESYYYFQDYDKAIQYFKKALAVPENEFNTMVLNSARNTMGLCYQKLNDFQLSSDYFNEVIHTRFKKPQKEWVRIAKGNLGYNFYLQGKFDQATSLLIIDFTGAEQIGDYGPAAGAAMPLADIYLRREDLSKAWYYLTHAKENIRKSEQTDRLRFWYPLVSKFYAAAGKQKLANIYLDSAINSINDYQQKFSGLKMMRASQKINLREEALRNAGLALAAQRKQNERNLLMALAVFLAVASLLVYRHQKRKRQAAEVAQQQTARELQRAQKEINRFIQKVSEQNSLVETFQAELHRFKDAGSNEKQILEKTLSELRSSTILTGEDWLYFRQHFATVYPDFERLLKGKYPTMTESELRYLMLTRLGLSHKEMAQMLGISTDGVRVTWNRVRKKMGGTLAQSAQQLLVSEGL